MFNNYRGFHLVEAHHNSRLAQWFHPNTVIKKSVQAVIVVILTLILWNIPADWFGIANLTIVQQRVIAIFAFATLMWVMEIVPSWATSVSIIVLMLLFTSDSGIAPMVQEEEVGKLLSYKSIMATFADPVIMLFIGGFIFGPLVQHAAFGPWWTGFPFGTDLTDNKTLLSFLFFVAALATLKWKHNKWVVCLAVLIMITVFTIPHSAYGSEYDYTTQQLKK